MSPWIWTGSSGDSATTGPQPDVSKLARHSGAALFALGAMAMLAPLFSQVWGVFAIGVILIIAGCVELTMAWLTDRRQARVASGVSSLLVGATLFFENAFVFSGLMSATSLLVAVGGVVTIVRAARGPAVGRLWGFFNGVANLAVAGLMWMLRGRVGAWGFGILLSARIAASGWQAWFAPAPSDADEFAELEDQHPDRALGLPSDPTIGVVHRQAIVGRASREPADFYWSAIFVATFFAIHVGRLHAEWTWLGLLSPAVATFGDLLTAIVVALAVLRPVESVWRRTDARRRAPGVDADDRGHLARSRHGRWASARRGGGWRTGCAGSSFATWRTTRCRAPSGRPFAPACRLPPC